MLGWSGGERDSEHTLDCRESSPSVRHDCTTLYEVQRFFSVLQAVTHTSHSLHMGGFQYTRCAVPPLSNLKAFPQPREPSNGLFKSHLLIMPRSPAHHDCRLEFYHEGSSSSRSFTVQQGRGKNACAYLQPGQSTPPCISRCGTGAEQLRKFKTVLGTVVMPTHSLSPKAQLALLGCFRFLLGGCSGVVGWRVCGQGRSYLSVARES